MASSDLAATYASLILADDGLEITVRITSLPHHRQLGEEHQSEQRKQQTWEDRRSEGSA
ncbi:hypothetical protein [Sporisorium scitamineum]|uniref:Uncharacterized protein n=1 Tax=Sporisorium scitamineum TaxID=49012 RepID=A0A0F7RS07_9BASI|nr:hypothetical protein [Sporisorium scitamineum]